MLQYNHAVNTSHGEVDIYEWVKGDYRALLMISDNNSVVGKSPGYKIYS